MSCSIGFRDQWPPYDIPTDGVRSRGPYPDGGSPPTSKTQTRAPLGPPPHRILLPPSYALLVPPISLPTAPTFPVPIKYSAPLLASRHLWAIEFALNT